MATLAEKANKVAYEGNSNNIQDLNAWSEWLNDSTADHNRRVQAHQEIFAISARVTPICEQVFELYRSTPMLSDLADARSHSERPVSPSNAAPHAASFQPPPPPLRRDVEEEGELVEKRAGSPGHEI